MDFKLQQPFADQNFQKDNNLKPTGSLQPDDATTTLLKRAIATLPKGHYRWRTVADANVRPEHAQYNGTIRSWNEGIHPGDDFGCRCWVEKIEASKDVAEALAFTKETLSDFDKDGYTLSSKLLKHYLGNTGNPIELDSKELETSRTVQSAIKTNETRFENAFTNTHHFKEKVLKEYIKREPTKPTPFYNALINLPDNGKIKLSDHWDVDTSWKNTNFITDPDFSRAIGSGKIRSNGNFEAIRKGDTVKITGTVKNQINDVYDFNRDKLADFMAFAKPRLLEDKGYAKSFPIHWQKNKFLEATITIKNGEFKNSTFKWRNETP